MISASLRKLVTLVTSLRKLAECFIQTSFFVASLRKLFLLQACASFFVTTIELRKFHDRVVRWKRQKNSLSPKIWKKFKKIIISKWHIFIPTCWDSN